VFCFCGANITKTAKECRQALDRRMMKRTESKDAAKKNNLKRFDTPIKKE